MASELQRLIWIAIMVVSSTARHKYVEDEPASRILNRPANVHRRSTSPQLVGNDKIVFPSPSKSPQSELETKNILIPGDCQSVGRLCDNVTNYPTENARAILDRLTDSEKNVFMIDSVDVHLSQRFGAPEEEELCETEEMIYFPQQGEAVDGNLYFILNIGKGLQGVRIERCKEGSVTPRTDLVSSFNPMYTATCKQKFGYRQLFTIEGEHQNTLNTKRSIKIPLCCKVELKPND